MIERVIGALGALAVAGLGVLILAAPAQAAEEYSPAAGWSVQDTTIGADVDWSDCDPGPVRVDSALSSIVDAHTVDLVGTGVLAPPHYGTSVETTDLGLAVSAGDTVSVDYELTGGADAGAGAVRLFIYDHADADTDCTAPTAKAVAPDDGSTSGTLEITVGFDGQIGTLGAVYDSSNGGVGGTVRFSNLTVAGTGVLFVAPPEPCEWDDSLTADDPECQPPASSTPDPTPAATDDDNGGAGGSDDSTDAAGKGLPVTGSSTPLLAGAAGAGLLGLGGGLWLLARKRRPTFSVE